MKNKITLHRQISTRSPLLCFGRSPKFSLRRRRRHRTGVVCAEAAHTQVEARAISFPSKIFSLVKASKAPAAKRPP